MIEKTDIDDNSIVLCGNQTACFIAPHQNPNVKYVAYSIPEHIQDTNKLFINTHSKYRNYYYTSAYLEHKIKEIIKTNRSVYVIFNSYNLIKDRKVYNKSLEYNSDGQIDKFKICNSIQISVFGTQNRYTICKIK